MSMRAKGGKIEAVHDLAVQVRTPLSVLGISSRDLVAEIINGVV